MPKTNFNDISLYYEIHGSGYPLLLISGINADSASWTGVRGRLAERFRVITFDNRSSGRSGSPGKRYSIREMAGDAIGLLDHLGIEKCHVMGHSMGGYIAQEMAINYPERIAKLILEATAPVSSVRNNMLFDDFLRRFEKDHDSAALMRSWACWSFSPAAFKRKNFVPSFIKKASAYPYLQSAKGFRSQADAVMAFDASARIKNIKARTLVIIGNDDILIYPSESMELVKGIKGSVFARIKDAGHCVHFEYPQLFASKVIRFLQ